jgi:hypothetical protein
MVSEIGVLTKQKMYASSKNFKNNANVSKDCPYSVCPEKKISG